MNYPSQRKLPGPRAQAIVEFAIVLPILMAILVGILEVGRMIFIYAAVTNASREAVRYGSAVGLDLDSSSGTYYQKYSYCKGIRSVAKRAAYFMNLSDAQISISYDRGPGTATVVSDCDAATGEDTDVKTSVLAGDRVLVTITATYRPLVNLIPIGPKPVSSSSARTILGVLDMSSGVSSIPVGGSGPSGGGGGGGGGGSSSTATATQTLTPTATATAMFTATTAGLGVTPTFPPASGTPTATSTFDPFATQTSAPSNTPTSTSLPTNTPTPTLTPTATSTPKPGCDSLSAGDISVSGNAMRLTIQNPHDSITVSNIQVTWNHDAGAGGQNPALTLQKISLGLQSWTVTNGTGPSATIIPVPSMVIPGNNLSSTVNFEFNKAYKVLDGTESIVINFSTSACVAYPIQRPRPTAIPTSAATTTPTQTPTP